MSKTNQNHLDTAEVSDNEKRMCLEDLLGRITEQNLHEEIDSGPPVGEEIW